MKQMFFPCALTLQAVSNDSVAVQPAVPKGKTKIKPQKT